MSHNLQALIVKEDDLEPRVRRVSLPQGFALIPADEYLLAEYPELDNAGTEGFSKLLCGGKPVAAVFTDYFGGMGEQSAEYFDGVKTIKKTEHFSIDDVLKMLGVTKTETEDEFDMLGLGKFRDTFTVLGEPRDLQTITAEEAEELCELLGYNETTTYKYSHFYPYQLIGGGFDGRREPDGVTIYIEKMGPARINITPTGEAYRGDRIDLSGLNNLLATLILKLKDENADLGMEKIKQQDKEKAAANKLVRSFLARKNFFLQKPSTVETNSIRLSKLMGELHEHYTGKNKLSPVELKLKEDEVKEIKNKSHE